MIRGPNVTSDCNYTKYTYNFPNNLRAAAEARIKELGIKYLSDYITFLIRRDVTGGKPDELVKVIEFCLRAPTEKEEVFNTVVGRRENKIFPFFRRVLERFNQSSKKVTKIVDQRKNDQYYFF